MLDTDTKRRIDTCRDILVGKVPDPKSQVEQITIALIYKFMDDMDLKSEEMGGKRSFFTGQFAKYAWSRLMVPGMGGFDMLERYLDAIARINENPGIPPLFRDIFKNAYLPYRDPETLRGFLKEIDGFRYDHSERLGDAFEYLLSVLGSQGDAGQFRTPRHLIDFMVAIVDPKKDETILDPACGTAGFLISAWKHIRAANTRDRPGDRLTPAERKRLADGIQGYDISPDMVRLSLVNLYLHGFRAPRIHEYDTLTSEARWNDYFDVILANPPFMSPKGGIRPHKRFSVQSKRSEVLFVDYMAEHLTSRGRAGIIVPEGIIFQSQNAYKQLRKLLVESYLVTVISLPAGCFNPYSGVKTSILILDKTLAKQADTIAFFKVENDGFGLGAQRRPIDKNDLPEARAEIAEYLRRLRTGEGMDGFEPTLGRVVAKERIAEGGEWNLSGGGYGEGGGAPTEFPFCSINDIAVEIRAGFASGKSSVDTAGVPHVRPMNISEDGRFVSEGMKRIPEEEFKGREGYALNVGDVLFNNTNSAELVGKTCLIESSLHGGFSNHMTRIRVNRDTCMPYFLALLLHSAWRKGQFMKRATRWVGQAGVNTKSLSTFQIPLPPLSVQKEIVAEIEGYQKIIDGARQVVENYRPHIHIEPEWPMVEILNLVANQPYSLKAGPFGSALRKEFYVPSGYKIYGQEQVIRGDAEYGDYYISEEKYHELESCKVQPGDVLISLVGTCGKTLIVPNNCKPGIINPRLLKLTLDKNKMLPSFFATAFSQDSVMSQVHAMSYGGTMNILSLKVLKGLRLPLPPLDTQRAIVLEIQEEQRLVDTNKELIRRFEAKIKEAIDRVWGKP
uniref:site-specific DNA-methyltransferase (adenine-specific) n=1 Tax=Candidatus Kentrum sp. LFY TaxID=2126342 RepID=A0A450UJ66_9GAMM|nr:MAG: type I restriction enzyme M protein [Candidatus Kentron sp. LFY]